MQLFVQSISGGDKFLELYCHIWKLFMLSFGHPRLKQVFFGLIGVDWVEVATTYLQKVWKLGESSRSEST